MGIVIAIDGPSASGKSTTAKLVARELGYTHLDTGAMYRAVTWAALQAGLTADDSAELAEILANLEIELGSTDAGRQQVLLGTADITDAIRDPGISRNVSAFSALQPVRERLVELQRACGKQGNVVCEGRDIGTHVFKDAQFKFFLIADARVRAERRLTELKTQGHTADVDSLVAELLERDAQDSTREHSPLRQAEDAVTVDTSNLTITDQVTLIINHVKTHLSRQGAS
jgi:cytidylate kinase